MFYGLQVSVGLAISLTDLTKTVRKLKTAMRATVYIANGIDITICVHRRPLY